MITKLKANILNTPVGDLAHSVYLMFRDDETKRKRRDFDKLVKFEDGLIQSFKRATGLNDAYLFGKHPKGYYIVKAGNSLYTVTPNQKKKGIATIEKIKAV